MALRMAKLSRTSTGLWTARKVIPADIREAYGKREDKPTWPASLNHTQARAEFAAWLMAVEDRIAALRSTERHEPLSLSQRHSRALAGRWYREQVAELSDDPGEVIGWEVSREELYPETDNASAYSSEPYEGPWRITPYLRKQADLLLNAEALSITDASRERLLQDMADLYLSLCDLMIRRASGDYGADPVVATLPEWQPVTETPTKPSKDGPTIISLFDGYVAERAPAPATVKAWKRMITSLTAFVGHDDASLVTADDVVRWKDHLLLERKLSAKTVREGYLSAAKAVFGWAKDNRRVEDNPAVNLKVRGGKAQRLRDPGFSDEEAKTILNATLATGDGRQTELSIRARRWAPWLCAYTGARVNEITQLRKQDVFEEDGIWLIHITPEAGGVKNQQARKVPIHSHLVEQGFVELVTSLPEGPIFYDPKANRKGSDGNPQFKKVGERLAKWVRSLGVDDPNVAPNHGWRHRFKTAARSARMEQEARDAIQGHAPASEGQRYGVWAVRDLAIEVEKLPRIALV
ncbi:site-specific integrase [Altererythrobacter sp. TH136]|uniref:site-specific integrase n=1 Tax=Altererythrobacter sp. TH136 TaxID=2067415 RepID=UPI001163A9C6|nr:site-specific integrase [Altererythrobacter sp. TH136]QDM41440.1 tyrosine-type recombinase/integrase [Altererythrobacter sp. TH136]